MRQIRDHNLSDPENEAVQRAIRGSLDLYRRYVKLRSEDTRMTRKQAAKRKEIPLLEEGLRKLRAFRVITVKE
jgi:hypothetical protein